MNDEKIFSYTMIKIESIRTRRKDRRNENKKTFNGGIRRKIFLVPFL